MTDDEKEQIEIAALRAKADTRKQEDAAFTQTVDRARNGFLKATRALYAKIEDLAREVDLRCTRGDDDYLADGVTKGRFVAPGTLTVSGPQGTLKLQPEFSQSMVPFGFGGLSLRTPNGRTADIVYDHVGDRFVYPGNRPVVAIDLVKDVA